MEHCPVICVSLDGTGLWGRMDTCICMAESLHCPPETITMLLISHAAAAAAAARSLQSCPIPSDPMDCSPPGSSIHGIFQARVLEWGAIAFSNQPYPNTKHFCC